MKRLIFLFLAASLTSPAYCEEGDTSQEFCLSNWCSFKLCGFDGCVWRAATGNKSGGGFIIDFTADKKHRMVMVVPMSNFPSWRGTGSNYASAQVRVDYQPIINTILARNAAQNMMVFNFNSNDFSKSYLDALKKGENFRVRMLTDDGEQTFSFSLNGANNAISRAQNGAWGKTN